MIDDGPVDRAARQAARPVLCYPPQTLPRVDIAGCLAARASARQVAAVMVPPRDARAIPVPAGSVLRIECAEGSQVGDLNLFALADPDERFYSGKTRALHGTHVSIGARLWSCLPHLRPMATVIADSLSWYGIDADGASVHDVIGTRCDPYTARLLGGGDYDRCCHSNLTRAVADYRQIALEAAERQVHDVLNVFMCTGFTRDAGHYFMKASPARRGDHIELFAEIDLLAVLSACPGGDCGSSHSSDAAACHPLAMEVWTPAAPPSGWAEPPRSSYAGRHGR